MDDRRRRKRQEMRNLQREATWLQKALFALGKATEAHERLQESRKEPAGEYTLEVNGRSVALEDLEDAFEGRVKALLESVRELRRELR